MTATPSTPAKPSSGRVDAFVAGAGTGGTITGISRALKKTHNGRCVVVGVDPVSGQLIEMFQFTNATQIGSILAFPDSLNTDGEGGLYIVEGIGYDFIPEVLSRDPTDVDHWLKTGDEESFEAVRKLMRMEGLLVGGSSGSALSGALRWLKSDAGRRLAQTKGANVVVLLPDGYMSVHVLRSSFANDACIQDQELHEQTVVSQDGPRGRPVSSRRDHRGDLERLSQSGRNQVRNFGEWYRCSHRARHLEPSRRT